MVDKKAVYEFAVKWSGKFQDKDITEPELLDHYMADDCRALGFEMDCGNAFSEVYGNAINSWKELDAIIDEVNDINLLGSAIFSQWRYFNHWSMSSVLELENRGWFITALNRLKVLAEQ